MVQFEASAAFTFVAVALAFSQMCGAGGKVEPDSGGRVIYVALGGKAGAAGTREAPLGRVQAALELARAADTVHLAAGVYRERVAFKHGGVYGKPVTLEGDPGAVLDGSEPVALHWTRAEDIAPGVWRASVSFFPFTVTADGKLVTALDEERVDPKQAERTEWQWPNIFKNGVGPSKWEGVKALVMYRHEQHELLIRFKQNLDPRTMTITVAPQEPVVRISGTNRCVVHGLALRNATYGVHIENSVGSVVENCVIGPTDFGVMMGDGADRCTIRFNEIFMNPYAGASPKLEGSWDNWLAHKEGGFYDRTGISVLASAGGHQIHDNYIHDHWDGIEDLFYHDEKGRDHDLNIHHNRIFNISDDGLEPNGEEVNCEWHDNIVEGCICGFRIKAPRVGPLYAYRNTFFDNGEDYRNFGGGDPMLPATVYVYQNTSTAKPAISHSEITGIGTPNYHFYNNLFWCEYPLMVSRRSTPPNWTADYNVYVRREDDGRWQERKQQLESMKQDAHSLWVETGGPGFADFTKQDVSLTPDSPTRARGADLSKLFGKPLPGCEPGYFTGPAPDCGALQFGQPMPRVPRRPEEVNAPPAGSWPGPEADSPAPL